jgi:hypothetical protein
MALTLHPEFQALLPPLTEDEQHQLEAHTLGFSGPNLFGERFIEIVPSDIGLGWWLAACRDITLRIEEYTKGPIAASRLCHLPWFRNNTFTLTPKNYHKPVGADFYLDYPPSQRPDTPWTTTLYVIQSVHGGPVKIGVSSHVEERLALLQVGSPYRLQIVDAFPGVPSRIERLLHKRYAAYRLHGEWFAEEVMALFTPAVLEEVCAWI